MNNKPYCILCGNSGWDVHGDRCTCTFDMDAFASEVSCVDIPEQYQGRLFDKNLVTPSMPSSYANYLQSLFVDITSLRMKAHSIFLASPTGTSKTTLAYCCIEQLFRRRIPTFPLYDILELKRILLDIDLCRKPFYNVENPENLYEAPYLFIKVPRVLTFEIYDVMSLLLDRRSRRGNSTIFLYNGTWESAMTLDRQGIITNLKGDGLGNSLEDQTWYPERKGDD